MEATYLFISGADWIWIIIIIGILLFGSKKIPEIARSLGKAAAEYEKGRLESFRELNEYKKATLNQEVVDRRKLEEIARILGIEYTNMSDEELKDAINKAIDKNKR